MSLNSADPPLPGSSCESATKSITAGRAINPLDPSELPFPKVALKMPLYRVGYCPFIVPVPAINQLSLCPV